MWRRRRENFEIVEEGTKKLRKENNKIVEEEENKNGKRGISKTLFAA